MLGLWDQWTGMGTQGSGAGKSYRQTGEAAGRNSWSCQPGN